MNKIRVYRMRKIMYSPNNAGLGPESCRLGRERTGPKVCRPHEAQGGIQDFYQVDSDEPSVFFTEDMD